MAIEKSLYSLPTGMEDQAAPEVEIEIEMEDGDEPAVEIEVKTSSFDENLAETISEGELQSISDELLQFIQDDITSRKDWERTYKDGLDLLGLRIDERTEPWDGACGVYHPILSESVVKFQSETILETFPASGPVKTKIIGKITREKEEAAARVQDDMNYELTEVMVEYRNEHERLLWNLPITGSAFKKVYFDPSINRQVAMFIPAEEPKTRSRSSKSQGFTAILNWKHRPETSPKSRKRRTKKPVSTLSMMTATCCTRFILTMTCRGMKTRMGLPCLTSSLSHLPVKSWQSDAIIWRMMRPARSGCISRTTSTSPALDSTALA